MSDDKLAALFTTQKSLTEWLQDINHKDAAAIRKEDNQKRERLRTLHELIDLPFDRPTQFSVTELDEKNAKFITFLQTKGDELCMLRLIPYDEALPKLRMRGKTIREAFAWFKEQSIDPTKYRADFVPHAADKGWATIFVVNQHGIHGEIIFGGHHQLTQGFHDEGQTPTVFEFNFTDWQSNPANPKAINYLKEIVAYLHIPDTARQTQLSKTLDATFAHDYLEGYFETTNSPSVGTWFIDYSPYLGQLYSDMATAVATATATNNDNYVVKGQSASTGVGTGPVVIVSPTEVQDIEFAQGSVLVCSVTSPDYVPLMQKAAAIVTDQGGILSHAAIVARELGKPCIVATGNATQVLRPGQRVTVDATAGVVRAG